MKLVFKICLYSEWQEAVNKGVYTGSALDLRDGFIHLSSSDQVIETAQLHFMNISDLLLVAVDPAGLDIRYEESRNGQMFPHLFSDLPVSAAVNVQPISMDADGVPIITADMLAAASA
ncbi:MAG: hypothetical protein CBC12_09530 [Candidatus Puniceispirillum sp. TMED52]|nr:dihydroorotate dehydrogenase [SAR116 cluster bacterium]OUU47383.1 MAG: hypothetical protein CBC12_09530 [Candidatus Puniceispirillum sp. TMED52]